MVYYRKDDSAEHSRLHWVTLFVFCTGEHRYDWYLIRSHTSVDFEAFNSFKVTVFIAVHSRSPYLWKVSEKLPGILGIEFRYEIRYDYYKECLHGCSTFEVNSTLRLPLLMCSRIGQYELAAHFERFQRDFHILRQKFLVCFTRHSSVRICVNHFALLWLLLGIRYWLPASRASYKRSINSSPTKLTKIYNQYTSFYGKSENETTVSQNVGGMTSLTTSLNTPYFDTPPPSWWLCYGILPRQFQK